MSWVQIPLARQTKKPGISTILGFFFYPAAKRFIRFYPMTVEPIWPCGLRDFCDVGTPPASQFDSAYRNFCGALDWFSLSVGGVGVSRGGVEFVPVDAGPVCGRDAVVRFGRRCLFALPQGVGDE